MIQVATSQERRSVCQGHSGPSFPIHVSLSLQLGESVVNPADRMTPSFSFQVQLSAGIVVSFHALCMLGKAGSWNVRM